MHETQARIQPEDVEEVPETANTLKQLKSAQGYGFSNFARVQKLICLLYFAFGAWLAQESVDFLDLGGEGLWDFEDAEEFSDDEQVGVDRWGNRLAKQPFQHLEFDFMRQTSTSLPLILCSPQLKGSLCPR